MPKMCCSVFQFGRPVQHHVELFGFKQWKLVQQESLAIGSDRVLRAYTSNRNREQRFRRQEFEARSRFDFRRHQLPIVSQEEHLLAILSPNRMESTTA